MTAQLTFGELDVTECPSSEFRQNQGPIGSDQTMWGVSGILVFLQAGLWARKKNPHL